MVRLDMMKVLLQPEVWCDTKMVDGSLGFPDTWETVQ
ncbi:hypothetical protein Goshw_017737 [Gossypium schwendimanii]|uniref:Uncharacterized protein n=1 Tax=Gossypium schwendimanii TaxID=34291 RepID=A0A7J9LWM3_GOSSC|nr:hypothetical protein [Gossypium schwendimanii]